MAGTYFLYDNETPKNADSVKDALIAWANKSKAVNVKSEIASDIVRFTIQHYNTNIVEIEMVHDMTTITLNHGGHMSATTKRFMNDALTGICRAWIGASVGVYQKKGEWYVTVDNEDYKAFSSDIVYIDLVNGKAKKQYKVSSEFSAYLAGSLGL